ncbi:hypothetical protein BRYFOR_09141 [Marvinbryantia formatexigens DSM 14469]|uniref:Uncharacterized protein n=1 Tax=Marvinbryantia formatexigens DSM 14469 TaxID=478749 RepID=C6LKF4_9FIRM|nr:hypothetical protein BRYFOR_09141 [Marvinbryantia formatexigens DSM 14469]
MNQSISDCGIFILIRVCHLPRIHCIVLIAKMKVYSYTYKISIIIPNNIFTEKSQGA